MSKRPRNKWDLSEITEFYKNVTLPPGPIVLDAGTTIVDPALFVERHLSVINHNNGNDLFRPYARRLYLLKKILEKK